MIRILVVDDERSLRDMMSIMLRKEGYEVDVAETLTAGLRLLEEREYDLVLTDLRLPDGDGTDVLKRARELRPEAVVMIITAYASTETAVNALRLGAYDYFNKPFDVEEVLVRIANALEKKRLEDENVYLRRELKAARRFDNIIGSSRPMVELFNLIPRIAATPSTVLITGESGTGKELIAKAIHGRSPRASRPFVAINCSAMQDSLLESELYGHVRGSFTGAVASKKGLFEVADGATLFLDEIGQMSATMQVKLLRALQEKRIRRVGGTEEIEVDVRIIAATNRDLERLVESGEFREDLFYRVNIIPLQLAPLRERAEDIPLLAQHFVERFSSRMGREVRAISRETMDLLKAYRWPGNVRELENVIERAVALEVGASILPERVASRLRTTSPATEIPDLPDSGFNLEAYLDDVTKKLIVTALARSGGVQKEAARLLGLTFRSFRYLVGKLGIKVRE